MIAASSNWSFVAAGYSLTAATLLAYVAWLGRRTRRVRRSFPDDRRA
jgi:hypothetical protein